MPHGSSHLPADSVGHVVVCLFGVAPRRDCRVSPEAADRKPYEREAQSIDSTLMFVGSMGAINGHALRAEDGTMFPRKVYVPLSSVMYAEPWDEIDRLKADDAAVEALEDELAGVR